MNIHSLTIFIDCIINIHYIHIVNNIHRLINIHNIHELILIFKTYFIAIPMWIDIWHLFDGKSTISPVSDVKSSNSFFCPNFAYINIMLNG